MNQSPQKKKETTVQLFKKYTYSPFQNRNQTQNQDELEYIAEQIYNWARNHGAQIVSFFAHPSRPQILQKHNTFLSLKFIKDNLIQSIGSQKLSFQKLWKQEIDGSSISNGGLRQTSSSRAYLLWDHLSQLFIRKKYGILYIPSFIITPQGNSSDDRMHFRKAEKKLKQAITRLLENFKIQSNGIFLGVSIQQQFCVLPKKFTQKRLDFKQTKRALIGKKVLYSPVSRNYAKKLPEQILKTLKQAEDELLQLGVPVKTHYAKGGVNQFQLCSQVEDARSVIDHNILKMMILQQACERNDLTAIFHQKPFVGINGSGKQINFSICYLDENQKTKNLYDLKSQHQQLLILMILITVKAVQNHPKLLVASTMTAGNEIRMGQKQTPLPIVSVSLGQQAANLIEGLPKPQTKNLKDTLFPLLKKQHPDVGDRNRTSSIAFLQNRFQFRLPGSSQNPAFPLTVIMTILLSQINCVLKKLQNGQNINKIIDQYRESSRKVRYQGDSYSQEWKIQAEKRHLYNPTKITSDYLRDVKTHSKVLIDNQIYTKGQIQAKYKRLKGQYFDTVKVQKDCLLKIINKNIIPRCYSFISTFPRELHLKSIESRMKKFDKLLQELIIKADELQATKIQDSHRANAYHVRQQIHVIGDIVDKILQYLPQSESFPQLYDNLNKWETV